MIRMNTHHKLLGLLCILLLVASSCQAPIYENNTNATNESILVNPVTTLITSIASSDVTITILTTESSTIQDVTSQTYETSTTKETTAVANVTTAVTSATTYSTINSTNATSPTTVITTTKAPGHRFDFLSFVGGIILATGLSAILYLVVSYMRRNNRVPYSNLR